MVHATFLVVGAGGVGPAIVHWLVRRVGSASVTLMDKDSARLKSLCTKRGFERVGMLVGDASDERMLERLIRPKDNIISAIPAKFSPLLAQRAVQAGCNFVDLGGVLSVSEKLREEFDERARHVGVSIIPDCGVMPGLGNMIAARLAYTLGGADDITIYVGGLPVYPRVEFGNYQCTFSLEGLLHILEPAPVIREGRIVNVDPFDGLETLDVPALRPFGMFTGQVEAFTTSGAGTAAWFMLKLGVQNFREKTVRWPGFEQFIRSIPRDQLMETLTQTLPVTDTSHPDLMWMRVIARRGARTLKCELLDVYDRTTGLSAMARTTGFSAAEVAIMASRKQTRPGALPPEEALGNTDLLTYLLMLQDEFHIRYTDSAAA